MTLSTFAVTAILLIVDKSTELKDIDRLIHNSIGLEFDEQIRQSDLYKLIYNLCIVSWQSERFNKIHFDKEILKLNINDDKKEIYQIIVQLFDKWKKLN